MTDVNDVIKTVADQLSPETVATSGQVTAEAEQTPAGSADPATGVASLEAVLFAAGEALDRDRLAFILAVDGSELDRLCRALDERLAADKTSGLALKETAAGLSLVTKSLAKPALQRMFEPRSLPDLSPATYEALAVIAYNQPCTRSQVEAVRGVNSDSVINRLVERGLVAIVDYLDAPGRPALFATTERFLQQTGLSSPDELEPLELMMYGTLQDIEAQVERHDKQ